MIWYLQHEVDLFGIDSRSLSFDQGAGKLRLNCDRFRSTDNTLSQKIDVWALKAELLPQYAQPPASLTTKLNSSYEWTQRSQSQLCLLVLLSL